MGFLEATSIVFSGVGAYGWGGGIFPVGVQTGNVPDTARLGIANWAEPVIPSIVRRCGELIRNLKWFVSLEMRRSGVDKV
jgi:hypothetical protein